nr:unnamed protein product [Callosobruchus analis]
MAFADDIVLLEYREENLPLTLNRVVEFAEARGLTLNPSKSAVICTELSRGTRLYPDATSTFKLMAVVCPW